ncbi:MAG TPA: DNA mismatch repair endonuclease MutL, partial [Candidatus Spyradosoma merdigallinarum]|nr:DNA mismatch repair endonuclease MutL [Candidatus Spyradosoma merdigallinarum]
MPEIRILPDNVANQIAAGEVVERPMSVVKELLENAIDAGATRISIGFRNGGKSFMSVEDNGCGMTRDQALLALERHATSKIRAASDLDEIRSFGFRGEALPSIASVSSFLLRTRTRDAELGTEILVEGGKYRACRENGMPAGTRIEISRLFFNVPARLKFLKSENTEAAHITRCVRLYAVAHPEIAFTLWENDREIFRSPAGTDLRERVGAIWGRQLADDLCPLDAAESAGMRISGLIGKPGVSRASRAEMVTVVNGRPVDNRTMAYSLVESFHTLIPRGRYPLAFLFLEIDPHAVDVNVHPAKREVRFRNESAVRNLIISAVLKTLGGNGEEDAAPPSPAPIPAI